MAREEMKPRDLKADLYTCGFKDLSSFFDYRNFDLVFTADNAIPNLLPDVEILVVYETVRRVCQEWIRINIIRGYNKVNKS